MPKPKRVEVVVRARCVACKHERDIKAGEVAPGDLPECDKCYSPMVAISAQSKSVRKRGPHAERCQPKEERL